MRRARRPSTLSLPGGARCNVTFVEVLVGRIELGESKRMNNPCPPPPTPTPVPAPAPPVKIVAGIDHNGTAFRTWTRNERLLVTDIPGGAAVELRCRGKGKVRRFTIRRSKTPATQLLCLPPGATRPARCSHAYQAQPRAALPDVSITVPDPALVAALDSPTQPRAEPVGDPLVALETWTGHAETGAELAQQLADGIQVADLEQWLTPALDLIDRLDRAGRAKEAVELARTAQRVLALARRWLALIELLRDLLRSDHKEAVAWAAHELGKLNLAAGRLAEADTQFERARSLWKELRDNDGLAAAQQSLGLLCQRLRAQLHAPPVPAEPRRPRRALLAVLALLLLLIGGVTGAALGNGDPPVELTAVVTGHGSVSAPSAGIDCPGTCSADVRRGEHVALVPAAEPGSVFAGWSGDCSGMGPCSVVLDANRTVEARFKRVDETRTLRAKVDGHGRVTSTPAGIDCGSTCSMRARRGGKVTLRATPTSGAAFSRWSGGGCSGSGACTVTLDASRTVTAHFTEPTVEHTLTVELAGDGTGTVTGGAIKCGESCTATLAGGTKVTLRAAADAGSTFAGWDGAGCSGTDACTVTLDASHTVTARFKKGTTTRTLTVERAGDGEGRVSGGGIDCGDRCAATVKAGAQVTLQAEAADGSAFAGWTGGGCGSEPTCTVTVSASETVTASFSKTPQRFSLTTGTDGDGAGTISPTCGAGACTYDADATVSVTAQPGTGSVLSGWSGCTSAEGLTCTVTMDADHSVVATFQPRVVG